MPYGLDPDGKNNRPLFIPDSVHTRIHLLHGCHQTIAYPHYPGITDCFAAGLRTYKNIIGGKLPAQLKRTSSWHHFGDKSSDIIFPKENRCVLKKTHEDHPVETIVYNNSVLYDVYQYFIKNNKGSSSFKQAISDPDDKYYSLFKWAYENSHFYRITGKKMNDVNDEVLAQAVQCQSREALTLLAMQYKYYGRCDLPVASANLTHQALEKLIASPEEEQKNYLRQRFDLERCHPLKRAKLVAKNRDQCARILHHAQKVVQHDSSILYTLCIKVVALIKKITHSKEGSHSGLKSSCSQGYHAADFEAAKRHFDVHCTYRCTYRTAAPFAAQSGISYPIVKQPDLSSDKSGCLTN